MAQIPNVDENLGAPRSLIFDTRSLSLGSATVSDVFGRASIGINPALSGLYETGVFIQANSYHNWDINLLQTDVTLPTLSAEGNHFTARFGFLNTGYNSLNYLGSPTLPVPDIEIFHAGLAYAYSFTDAFSLGILQSISFANNEQAQFWTYFADIGLAYAPYEAVSYGIVFRGIGHEPTYEIIETGQTTLGSRLLRQSLELGATLRFPTEQRRPYLAVSFANEKRFGEQGLWYKGGVEIMPSSIFAIRSGILFHLDQSVFIPRFGLGFMSGAVRLDYMIAPKDFSGEHFHQIGLTLQF